MLKKIKYMAAKIVLDADENELSKLTKV